MPIKIPVLAKVEACSPVGQTAAPVPTVQVKLAQERPVVTGSATEKLMRFSLVIPLFNKAPYIVATVESVLAQTLQDFEVWVVDDGSDDGGADLVEAMSDHRVNLVRQKNAGVSAARNLGINLAQGDWVAFLDADDWHHPLYLETLAEVQRSYQTAHVVAANYIPVPHANDPWPPFWPSIDKRVLSVELIEDLPHRWTLGPCLLTSGVAVRRETLIRMQPCFPLGESRVEDLDLWFRLAERSPVALVHLPLVAYRVGIEGSLTENRDDVIIEPYMLRMRERAHYGTLTLKQRRSALQLVAHFEVSMARQAIVLGNRLEAINWLVKGRDAISRKRWWVTALMAISMPGNFVRRWEQWRIRRKAKALKPVEGK